MTCPRWLYGRRWRGLRQLLMPCLLMFYIGCILAITSHVQRVHFVEEDLSSDNAAHTESYVTRNTSFADESHAAHIPTEVLNSGIPRISGNSSSGSYLSEVEVIQRHRQEVLREVCRRNPLPAVNIRQLRWSRMSDKLQLIYCGIPKCGTTSWTAMELEILGEKNATLSKHFSLMAKHGIQFFNKVIPNRNNMHKLQHYYNFLFVRHPLEKLLSAWKDKLAQKHDREYFHKKIGIPIIKKYRRNPSQQSLARGDDTTFPEFVKYVIDVMAKPRSVDEHIQLMHRQCDPCHVKYDFIGKMETFHEDAEYVLRHGFHVDHVDSFPAKNQAAIASSHNATEYYYSQVPAEDIAKLNRIYRLDIELFAYSTRIPGTNFL